MEDDGERTAKFREEQRKPPNPEGMTARKRRPSKDGGVMAQAVPPEKMTARKAQAVKSGGWCVSRYSRDKGSTQAVTTTAQRAVNWAQHRPSNKEEIGSLPDPISMRPGAAASGSRHSLARQQLSQGTALRRAGNWEQSQQPEPVRF